MTFITIQELCKTCQTKTGPARALNGLSLSVEQETVRGLLSLNGTGETTSMKVLTTLLRPKSGRASIAGIDILTDPAEMRPLIGTSGQYAAVDEVLTARESLVLVGRLHRIGIRQTRRRVEELLGAFDLAEAVGRPLRGLSDGMRRRVNLAGTLVINPPVLFLDEPAIDLDPRARMGLWEVIRKYVGEETTVLLTAQHLEEVDQLADSVPVIDRGHIIAGRTADELKASVGGKRTELTLVGGADTDRVWRIVASSTRTEMAVTGRVLTAQVGDPTAALIAVLKILGEESVKPYDTSIRRPALDDIFLTLTGHAAEEQKVAA